jgi:integrase
MHGFRSSFKDWCNEATNISNRVSEACLAHKIKDQTEAAYSRSDLFDKRRDVMEQWAAYCHGADNVAVLEVVK